MARPGGGALGGPSDSTICRVLMDTDPDALQAVLSQWAAPRLAAADDPPALAADGKRIRGANRHADDATHFETVTLVTHAGRLVASRCRRDDGEAAALRALLEDVDLLPNTLAPFPGVRQTFRIVRECTDAKTGAAPFPARLVLRAGAAGPPAPRQSVA